MSNYEVLARRSCRLRLVSSAMAKCAEYTGIDPESAMSKKNPSESQRPRAITVFAAAFAAGAVAAVGINRTLDVHLAQAKPQVECEPIFVALRDLSQGSPVTVFDVALQEWPKAMMPSTALRAKDSFDGMLMKHPIREGQPLLSGQLVEGAAVAQSDEKNMPLETYEAPVFQPASATHTDTNLWVANSSIPPTDVSEKQNTPPLASNINQTVGIEHQEISESKVIDDSSLTEVSSDSITSDSPLIEQADPVAHKVDPEPAGISTPNSQGIASNPEESVPTEALLSTSDPEPEPVIATPSMTEIAELTLADNANPEMEQSPEEPSGPTSTQPTTPSPKRYLVVPESIAIQAERSFTSEVPRSRNPQPVDQQMAAQNDAATISQTQTATTPAAQKPSPSLTEATKATASPSAQTQITSPDTRQQKTSSLQKSSQMPSRQQGTRSTSVPRVSQAPTLETYPNKELQKKPSVFSGMFPNIRATVGAVEEELQKIRQERSVSNQQQSVATQKPTAEDNNQPTPSTKSARWPWSFGR